MNHPAPFPVELPQRLIELYTYAGDLVLDPFMGAGSTTVAAVRTGRHYVGFDTDPDYIAGAEQRIADARIAIDVDGGRTVVVPPSTRGAAKPSTIDELLDAGAKATAVAERLLADAGFTAVSDRGAVVRERGVDFDLRATGADGSSWMVVVAGGFTASPTGLRRSEILWRTIGRAAAVSGTEHRVLVLTTELPTRRTAQDKALRGVLGGVIAAAIELTDDGAPAALRALHAG